MEKETREHKMFLKKTITYFLIRNKERNVFTQTIDKHLSTLNEK